MITSRILPSLLVFLSLIFALSSCSKSNDKGTNARVHSWKSEIKLEDAVADQGCLSLPKLFQGLRELDPALSVLTIPTAISFESPFSIRENFRRLVAYGQLHVEQENISFVQSLPNTRQDACSKVIVTGTDGREKEFSVKVSSRDSIMAEADDGERLEYAWLSPKSVRSRHRYQAYDLPCGASDKPVLVTINKVIDWSGAEIPATVGESSAEISIEAAFLTLAAEAVGVSPDSLYVSVGDGARRIDMAKVAAIASKSPRADVLSCAANVTPPPAPQPAPVPGPDDPLDPDHPHDDDGSDPTH